MPGLLGLTTTVVAWTLLAIVVVGWLVYWLLTSSSNRREVGAELDLAPNRKPYYDDETLEGRRLERVQLYGLLLLVVIVIGLPLYWVLEPDRQAGAREGLTKRLAGWGEELFETTANGGFNCAGCHGGMNATGGSAPYTLTNQATGQVSSVTWTAPALNTVFYRYSEEEVRFILTYGRPGSPMPAWGLDGGGPMNAQQIETLIEYLKTIQIPREDCSEEEADDPLCETGHLPAENQAEIDELAQRLVEDGTYSSYGEALFNLDLAGGAYSCARCHTRGWSYGNPGVPGQGAFGWNLTGGSENARFPNVEDQIEFVKTGSEIGTGYAPQAQGTGRMPAFGTMLTDQQIRAIIEYVRGL
jgi:mono/diheme cytochrome c family protein